MNSRSFGSGKAGSFGKTVLVISVSFRSIVKGTSEEIEFDVAKLVLSASVGN